MEKTVNYIVRGADKRGIEVGKLLSKEKNSRILGYIDKDDSVGEKMNCTIYNWGEGRIQYVKGNVDMFAISYEYSRNTIDEMIREMTYSGVNIEDIIIVSTQEKVSAKNYLGRGYLPYLEYHVCDQCNLNCAGCSHFSSLCKEDIFVDYNIFKTEFEKLKKLIPEIDVIRILGGEPLLHKQLFEFIKLTRNLYFKSEIRLTTNGILIKQMDDQLIDCINQNNIILEITLYQPLYEKMMETIAFLREKRITFEILTHGMWEFEYPLLQSKVYKMEQARKQCPTNCVEFRNGKIYPCPIAAFIRYYNNYWNENIKEESGFLINKNTEFKQLKLYIENPMECCEWCALPVSAKKRMPWKQFDGVNNDWVVENDK